MRREKKERTTARITTVQIIIPIQLTRNLAAIITQNLVQTLLTDIRIMQPDIRIMQPDIRVTRTDIKDIPMDIRDIRA